MDSKQLLELCDNLKEEINALCTHNKNIKEFLEDRDIEIDFLQAKIANKNELIQKLYYELATTTDYLETIQEEKERLLEDNQRLTKLAEGLADTLINKEDASFVLPKSDVKPSRIATPERKNRIVKLRKAFKKSDYRCLYGAIIRGEGTILRNRFTCNICKEKALYGFSINYFPELFYVCRKCYLSIGRNKTISRSVYTKSQPIRN